MGHIQLLLPPTCSSESLEPTATPRPPAALNRLQHHHLTEGPALQTGQWGRVQHQCKTREVSGRGKAGGGTAGMLQLEACFLLAYRASNQERVRVWVSPTKQAALTHRVAQLPEENPRGFGVTPSGLLSEAGSGLWPLAANPHPSHEPWQVAVPTGLSPPNALRKGWWWWWWWCNIP